MKRALLARSQESSRPPRESFTWGCLQNRSHPQPHRGATQAGSGSPLFFAGIDLAPRPLATGSWIHLHLPSLQGSEQKYWRWGEDRTRDKGEVGP